MMTGRASNLAGHLRRFWAAYLVLVIALASTGLFYRWAREQVRLRQQASFDRALAKFRHTMELHFSAYVNILRGTKALFDASRLVTPEEFHAYLRGIDLAADHPGLYDLSYIIRVRGPEKQAHLDLMRQLGFQDYHPQLSGDDPEYALVAYWDDFSTNDVRHSGYNVYADPRRREAMDKARDTGNVASTSKLHLLTRDPKNLTDGFLLYVPIYRGGATPPKLEDRRAALAGFICGAFSCADFWREIYTKSDEPLIDFEVYEGLELKEDQLWYDADGVARPEPPTRPRSFRARYTATQQLGGLERTWSLSFASLPAFEASPEARFPALALAAGGVVSLALFGLAWTQARARARAEQFAAQARASNEAVAAETERLAVTLRSIGDGVITTDTQGRIVLMNGMAEEFTGSTQQAAAGTPLEQVFRLVDAESRAPLPSPVGQVLEQGGIVRLARPAVLPAGGGSERLVAHTAAPIRDPQGVLRGVVLVVRDITERQRLLEEQMKTAKLESIGLLAGGIAHDFNNILTTILGNVSLAALSAPADGELRECLTDAEKACGRARELTQQLLTFARGGAPIRQAAVLAEIIRESARFATPGSKVRCEFSLPDNLYPVEVDKGQVSQVIHNLVLNAEEAMPQGGAIRIAAENVELEGPAGPALPPGRYVRVSVRDEGMGIPSELLPKIFDPYFTTKQRGSGLGLATAYSIIKKHQGSITVESAPGTGSCFQVYLPAADKPPAPASPPSPEPLRGVESILVMDDEPPVLRTVSLMLTRLGYEVVGAGDGVEAVRQYENALRNGRPFAAVILDLTVPGGVGGRETLERLRALDPGVRAIVASGYSNDPVMAEHRRLGFQATIGKPFAVDQLGRVLRAVLDSA